MPLTRPESRGAGASPDTPASRSADSKAFTLTAGDGEGLSTEDDAEAKHAQDDLGVAVAAKSVLDHRVGVADFGVEGHHLLGQAGDYRGGELLSRHDAMLGVGGVDGCGRDGIGVAGVAFTQPSRQSSSTGAAQPVGSLVAGEPASVRPCSCCSQTHVPGRGRTPGSWARSGLIARVRSATRSDTGSVSDDADKPHIRFRSYSTVLSGFGDRGCGGPGFGCGFRA